MLILGLVILIVLVVIGLVVGVVLLPVMLPLAFVSAIAGQPFQTTPPGVVPVIAMPAPEGPLLTDGTGLMAAIQPWLGTPYVFGANGPPRVAVDCSGFTLAIMRQVYGVTLPRTAQGQSQATRPVLGTPEPGDLVFFSRTYASPDFITHVGIYVGDGVMVSAIEPRLGRQSLSSPYWIAHFAGFGRVRR